MCSRRKSPSQVQNACAVLLIVSSIALATYQVVDIDDVANGTLMYIAQAFLLTGSIFGLDYYLRKYKRIYEKGENHSERDSQ